MISENARLCNGLLTLARRLAKEQGLELGSFSSYRGSNSNAGYWFDVYEKKGDGPSLQVWTGRASCAADAKQKYIMTLIDPETEDPDPDPEVI